MMVISAYKDVRFIHMGNNATYLIILFNTGIYILHVYLLFLKVKATCSVFVQTGFHKTGLSRILPIKANAVQLNIFFTPKSV